MSLEQRGPEDAPAPLAVDLFPREIVRERAFSRSFAVTGGLKLAFAEVSVEGKQEGDLLRYEPELTAAGLLTSSPSWSFSAPSRRGVLGIKELFLLVKKPKGLPVHGRFSLSAEVQTRFGGVPLRRYADSSMIGASFPIAP